MKTTISTFALAFALFTTYALPIKAKEISQETLRNSDNGPGKREEAKNKSTLKRAHAQPNRMQQFAKEQKKKPSKRQMQLAKAG